MCTGYSDTYCLPGSKYDIVFICVMKWIYFLMLLRQPLIWSHWLYTHIAWKDGNILVCITYLGWLIKFLFDLTGFVIDEHRLLKAPKTKFRLCVCVLIPALWHTGIWNQLRTHFMKPTWLSTNYDTWSLNTVCAMKYVHTVLLNFVWCGYIWFWWMHIYSVFLPWH